MSLVDKVIAAVTPPESDQDRAEARARAREAVSVHPGGWLAMVLDHHLLIEAAFADVRTASTAVDRTAALQRLGGLLTGHSMAEEAVLYPALALHGEKADSEKAYVEQSAAKVQIAALEVMDPMSQDYLDKLEHVRGAVAHHVYEEEGEWYPDLSNACTPADNARLTQRYQEEFARYRPDVLDAAAT
jgi:hypothetical protein